MTRRIALTAIALVPALVAGRAAAETPWKLDKAHSSVNFSVSHYVISEVTGKFRDFDVTFVTNKDDFSDAKLSATIKTASINTENERRDNHLKSGDFLEAETFPEMTFVSSSFAKTGVNTFDITGDLTIRGITKAVVLHAVYKGTVETRGQRIIAFSAATEVNRFDYGVKWDAKLESGGLVAGDKISIEITYEGVKQ
jgi:polyisoprenoid-binding protein YceI